MYYWIAWPFRALAYTVRTAYWRHRASAFVPQRANIRDACEDE